MNQPVKKTAGFSPDDDDARKHKDAGGNIPLISIVIPIFNEIECLPELVRRLLGLQQTMMRQANLEFIFVDDGSSDGSAEAIAAYAEEHQDIKVLKLSRNFGHQIAVSAGIDACSGEYVVLIDGDLQDPPELIQDMFELAGQGYDVVYGQRRQRAGESRFKNISAWVFYRLIGSMSETSIPPDTGDFRLMTRRVADVLKSMRETNRFLRGMVPWAGFRSTPLMYDRDQRYAGTTKYPLNKMIGLAINAITSFSAKPLLMVTRLGMVMVGLGAVSGIVLLYLRLFTSTVVPGITSILISILVFNGLQIIITGFVGLYVAKLFDEIKGRPLYVVEQKINF